MKFAAAVAWHNPNQLEMFLRAWGLDNSSLPDWLVLQQDKFKEGGSKTKNKAIRAAIERGGEHIIVLDDDCFPVHSGGIFEDFCERHVSALAPQPVKLFETVTSPPSRGTPFYQENLTVMMPVAAAMGFWTEIGDYCAPRQLVYGATHSMIFKRETVFGRYFPLCGMNYSFRVADWQPWCYLIENVGRFDDIWMGYLWQKEAIRRGCCFNLCAPCVRHSRQSNVWANLIDEAQRLEANETLWKTIATSPLSEYEDLVSLIPRSAG